MSFHVSRRRFLQSSAAAAVTAAVYRNAMGANDRLAHACIGVGGMMGGHDFGKFRGNPKVQLVAICDVDANHLAGAKKAAPDARAYADWRELLAKEGDKVDSVNATVPDHMHAAISMSALHAGKGVYCQKPLTHDVFESRMIAQAAAKSGKTTQLGTQFASGIGDRLGVHYLRSGAIGKARRAYLCSNRTGAIDSYRLVGPRPAQGEKPPGSLSWDLWLGTAPVREFAPSIYHPVRWRAWQDFGTGWSGDIGCHIFDAAWKGLDLKTPTTVTAEVQKSWEDSPARRGDTWPQGDHITWQFPANAHTVDEGLTLEWFDGVFFPPKEAQDLALQAGMSKFPEEGLLVVGTEGAMLLGHQTAPILLPKDKFKGTPKPNLEPRDHYDHFVNASLGGPKTESHFVQTGAMAEAILLGTVAIRCPGKLLEWNAPEMKIPNSPQAEKFLKRTYRDGWKVEGL